MAITLTPKDRQAIDYALPFGSILSGMLRKGSNILFPKLSVIDGAYVTAATAALTVAVNGGFVRDANSVVVEVAPAAALAGFAAPGSAGQSIVYLVSFNPVTKALVVTAGTAAVTASALAPAAPVGNIPLATVTVANGDTTTTQAKIDNVTVRNIF